jgi:hypothetical protein
MAKKERKKKAGQAEINHAEFLYCEKKWPPERIAEAIERDIKTIYSWRDKYRWEETRDLFDTGPIELKRILLKEATRIARGEPRFDSNGNELPPIDADALSKVMKAYDYMSKKAGPAVCRDVLIELDGFICAKDPKAAAEMTVFHKQFLIYKIELENGN